MENDQEKAQKFYGNKIRVRACGICVEAEKILMIGHKAIVGEGIFWCPPGGGIEAGETAEEALKREFLEETGLEIAVKKLLFTNEFIKLPLQSVELFFEVKTIGGKLKTGIDPEMNFQIIDQVKWLDLTEIQALKETDKHTFWNNIKSVKPLKINHL